MDQIRAVINDPQSSLKDLEEMEKEHFKPQIQRLITAKSTEELKELIIVFNDLANLMKKIGDLNGKLVHYTDVAIVHQYVLTILEEKLSDTNHMIQDTYSRLGELQESIFYAIGGDFNRMLDVEVEANSYREKISKIREETKKKIRDSDMNSTKELFEGIATKMKNFLAKVINDSEGQMAMPPPCSYAVIGLGSMALQQITPYSDLEFAILVDNEDFRSSTDPKVRDYFENLSHLAHFKVIGLRETVIATSKYGVDTSHLVKIGVNFDLGGKTPLGRIDNDKPYSLIKTVDWMLEYVYNKEDKASHIDKNLPYILENVCYVYGDEKLVTTYQGKIVEFLGSKDEMDPTKQLNCEIRAIRLLKIGAVEFDYARKTLHEHAVKGDLEKHRPKLVENKGSAFNVKEDIYRLPDRLIYNFGLFFNVTGSSGWDIVEKLCVEQILTERAAVNLKRAISFASLLRLKAYLHTKSQDEGLSIFPKQPDLEVKHLQLTVEDLSEDGELFQFFYSALPLYRMLHIFCDRYATFTTEAKRTFFRKSDFYQNDVLSKGMIHYRLSQYEIAERCLGQAVVVCTGEVKYEINFTLGDIYKSLNQSDLAIKSFQECMEYLKMIGSTKRLPDLVVAHIKLGSAFLDFGQDEKAIECYEAGLELLAQPSHNDHRDLRADLLKCLGCAFSCQGEYDKAESFLMDSLKLQMDIYKNQPHLDTALVLLNLGCLSTNKGYYEKAIGYYEDTLRIQRQCIGDEPHMDIAWTLNYLADIHQKKCQYAKAIEYLKMSLQIQKVIFKGKPHSCLTKSLTDLGCLHNSVGLYNEAEEYLTENLKMVRAISNKTNHRNVALAFNSLGLAYQSQGKFDQAIACYEDEVKILKVLYKNKDHPCLANALNNLGVVFCSKALYEKAIMKFKESLRINKMVYNTDVHPNVAATMHNMGGALHTLGRHKEAIECFEKSLTIHMKIHKETPHEAVATVLINLGNCFSNLNELNKALNYYLQGLRIVEQIFSGKPQPLIATAHINLGVTYLDLGLVDQAIVHYEKALQTQRSLYGDRLHPDVGVTLVNLGIAFSTIGRAEEAIDYFVESIRIQTNGYQSDDHPNVKYVIAKLEMALETHGAFSRAFQAFMQNKERSLEHLLQNAFKTIIRVFARFYALDFTTILRICNDCLARGLDFTDSSTLLNSVKPELPDEDVLENYKLAAIFLSEANTGMRKTVFDKLADLTGVNQEDIRLWLRKDSWFPLGKNTRLNMAKARGDHQLVSIMMRMKCSVNEPSDYL